MDWDPGGGHAVENAPGMRKYRVAYERNPAIRGHAGASKLDVLNEIRASIRATPGWA